jgi:hypothetical protein
MNYDNRDYEILNTYNNDDLIKIIKTLNLDKKINKTNDKNKIIKLILKYYYIDNNNNKLYKKYKSYNTLNKRFNLLKLAYIAGNDNNENIIEMNNIKNKI